MSSLSGLAKIMSLRRQCKNCHHSLGFHKGKKCNFPTFHLRSSSISHNCKCKKYEEELVDRDGKPAEVDATIKRKIEKSQKKRAASKR
jgi:hypothetical protein